VGLLGLLIGDYAPVDTFDELVEDFFITFSPFSETEVSFILFNLRFLSLKNAFILCCGFVLIS
jgi:hypothetical protein